MKTCQQCCEAFEPHHHLAIYCQPCRRKIDTANKRRLKNKWQSKVGTDGLNPNRRAYLKRTEEKRLKRESFKKERDRELADLIEKGRAHSHDKPWLEKSFTPGQRKRVRAALCRDYALRVHLSDTVRRRIPGRKISDHVREGLVSGTERRSLCAFLGWTIPQLRTHLERQFVGGMSWESYDLGLIHIDHIRSLRLYDLSKPAELKAAWCLSNLRPIWARDNLSKGGRLELLC